MHRYLYYEGFTCERAKALVAWHVKVHELSILMLDYRNKTLHTKYLDEKRLISDRSRRIQDPSARDSQ
jgi:hypothetical protein